MHFARKQHAVVTPSQRATAEKTVGLAGGEERDSRAVRGNTCLYVQHLIMFSRAVVDCVSPAQSDLASPDTEHNRRIPAPIAGLASAIYCAGDRECRGSTRHLEKAARTGDYRDGAASSGNTCPTGIPSASQIGACRCFAPMLPIMLSGSFAEMAPSGGNAAFGCFDEHNRPLNIEAVMRSCA
jgi:hypothetical protein